MGILSIALIDLRLSMNALLFQCSVFNGMTIRDLKIRHALKIGIFFDGIQQTQLVQ